MRRSIALVLSLVMASCVSLNVMAIDANTPEKVSLKTVFEEAAAKAQPHTRSGEAEPQYYEEYTTPDGDVIEYIGYDTDYVETDDQELLPNQEADGRIYMMQTRTTYDKDTTRVWGYFYSLIKYYSRTAVTQGVEHDEVRIDSFSYRIAPASGYTFSSLDIHYYSYNILDTVDKYITATQTTMTNYPTTSLLWVISDAPALANQTGVDYKITVNGKVYPVFTHVLV